MLHTKVMFLCSLIWHFASAFFTAYTIQTSQNTANLCIPIHLHWSHHCTDKCRNQLCLCIQHLDCICAHLHIHCHLKEDHKQFKVDLSARNQCNNFLQVLQNRTNLCTENHLHWNLICSDKCRNHLCLYSQHMHCNCVQMNTHFHLEKIR